MRQAVVREELEWRRHEGLAAAVRGLSECYAAAVRGLAALLFSFFFFHCENRNTTG